LLLILRSSIRRLLPYTTLFRPPCVRVTARAASVCAPTWTLSRFSKRPAFPGRVATKERCTPAGTTATWPCCWGPPGCSHGTGVRSEEHTSELQSRVKLVCRLLV